MKLFRNQAAQFDSQEMRLLLSLVNSRMYKQIGTERTFQSLGKVRRKLTKLINK